MENCISTPKPTRVLHLVHWLNRGGIEMWLLAMMRNTERNRLSMDVCCKGSRLGELETEFRHVGAGLHHLPQGKRPWLFVKKLSRLLLQESYDALHVHTGVHSGWAVKAAKLANVPVITTFHNTQFPRESSWTSRPILGKLVKKYASSSLRYAVQSSHEANAVSQGVAQVVKRVTGLSDARCNVAYLGVPDPHQMSSLEIEQKRRSLGFGPEQQVMIHVGSLSEQKNQLGLLEVFRRVHLKLPHARLLIVGDGPLKTAIESRVAELNLASAVSLLGLRDDVSQLLQASNALVFPSIREGLSLTLMEASAVGLPIVASEIPGNVEATNGGESAKLHNVNDLQGMANSVIEIFTSKHHAKELGHKARQMFLQKFSLNDTAQQWVQRYDNAISSIHETKRLAA